MNNQNEIKNTPVIPRRVLSSLLSSISAGVVPRSGVHYIAIGRKDEISAFLSDLEEINEGGGAMRFLIGRYGSGKSFLIQLVRGYALERDFLTADCDLSPERRLCGSGHGGISTYRELMKNLASKSSPDGGALSKVITRWIGKIRTDLIDGGISPDDEDTLYRELSRAIHRELDDLEYMVGGFDFARVLFEYYKASVSDGELANEKMSACLRWFRGEFSNKTEAKRELGFSVSSIIDDDNWYDHLKLWAVLSKKMGYRGLVVFIDECVNLYKIPHRISRENNYEKILSMFNDTLQGRAPGLDIIFGGTPQFLEDTRRGIFSYEALRSRLCDSKFALDGFKNLIGPVIRLRRLSDDELFALIQRVTTLYSQYYNWDCTVTNDDRIKFLNICLSRAGADSMITPREMLRDYMTVLNILMQNPDAKFDDVIGNHVTLKTDKEDDDDAIIPEENNAKSEIKKYTANDIEF